MRGASSLFIGGMSAPYTQRSALVSSWSTCTHLPGAFPLKTPTPRVRPTQRHHPTHLCTRTKFLHFKVFRHQRLPTNRHVWHNFGIGWSGHWVWKPWFSSRQTLPWCCVRSDVFCKLINRGINYARKLRSGGFKSSKWVTKPAGSRTKVQIK